MVQLYISNEIGREIVNALGEIGEIQFRDVRSIISFECFIGCGTFVCFNPIANYGDGIAQLGGYCFSTNFYPGDPAA